jgi:hypothetical protein
MHPHSPSAHRATLADFAACRALLEVMNRIELSQRAPQRGAARAQTAL